MSIPEGAVSVMDERYGATGLGPGHDDTEAFVRAVMENPVVYCPEPPVGYVVGWQGIVEHELKIAVPIPGGRTLLGDGAKVFTMMPDKDAWKDSTEHSARGSVSWFFPVAGADDVTFRGLDFVGEGPTVTPQNHRLNLQMSVLEPMWGPQAPKRLRVERCGFFNQWGFSIHQRGGGSHYRLVDCSTTDCMNGVNVNSDYQLCDNWDIVRSEGFECTGTGSKWTGSRLRDVYGAFSIGGDMGGGPESRSTDLFIAYNTITRVLPGHGGTKANQGIVIADNVSGWEVLHNNIHDVQGVAILVAPQTPARPKNGRINHNTIRGAYGPAISLVACDDLEVEDNDIADQDEQGRLFYPPHRTVAAILLDAGYPGENVRISRTKGLISGQRQIVVPPRWRNVTIDGARVA